MTSRQSQLDLADIFGSVVNQLRNDRNQINALDDNGNHGDNALFNFELIENVLGQMRGQDAGAQLRQAANALQNNGRGATANLYAGGLLEAAQQLQGRQGIGVEDIMPLLQGLLGGVRRNTTAQPGQGTMLDTLLPAITGYVSARSSGQSNGQAIQNALGAAMRGAQQTYQQPALFGRSGRQAVQPRRDPGALSANSVLEGIFRTLTNL